MPEGQDCPRFPDRGHPILIPVTSPTSYISFKRALNLRLDGEFTTGIWHFETRLCGYPEPTYAPLAGHDGLENTVPVLDSLGVRDMDRDIASYGMKPYNGPVWMPNHYRAIGDIAMHQLLGEWPWEVFPTCHIDARLRSEEDFEILARDYLQPLQGLVGGEIFDA